MIVCRARQSCLRGAAKREGVNFFDILSSSDEDGVNSVEYQLTLAGLFVLWVIDTQVVRRVYKHAFRGTNSSLSR